MQTHPYTHRVKANSKSLKISIDPSGEVIVTTPRFVPQLAVSLFVKQHTAWITKQLEKAAALPSYNSPTKVSIFNTEYTKKVEYDNTKPFGISIRGSAVVYNLLSSPGNEALRWNAHAEESLLRFLQKTARAYILPRTQTLGQKMKTTYERVSLKEQKTRWGSCSSRGNLNFNWRLVHFKPEIINYVIIHELAHRTHMDHSHLFWRVVGAHDPEYAKHRGWLKRQGGSVG